MLSCLPTKRSITHHQEDARCKPGCSCRLTAAELALNCACHSLATIPGAYPRDGGRVDGVMTAADRIVTKKCLDVDKYYEAAAAELRVCSMCSMQPQPKFNMHSMQPKPKF